MFYLILSTILLASSAIFYIFILNKIETPQFLNKEELYKLLVKDEDRYYKTFNENDLKVRKVNSEEDYHKKIKNSVSDFTQREKELLATFTKKAKKILRESDSVPGFDTMKASRIPVIFGCIIGEEYEEGLPHTRYPAIILNRDELDSSEYYIVKLIIHELTHIYQKMYPNDIKNYLKINNFEIVGNKKNERANPDLDGYIYKNTLTNQIYEMKYKENPSSIGDVYYSSTHEHPLEEMAYAMENIVRKNYTVPPPPPLR